MIVRQLMKTSIRTCHADDTLATAAQAMWEHDCGCLPVVDAAGGASVVGMITDRDICMCALLQGKVLSQLRVSDAMATDVVTCRPTDTLVAAEVLMREARIRRLPVVDDHGVLAGMLTLADLAREAAREQCSPHQHVTGDDVGITLASICG
jgi:CBS domain-containing protein